MFEDPDDDDTYVIFNIHGYWFRCLKTDITGNNIYAFIRLYNEEGVGWRLSSTSIGGSGLDDEGEFKGLGFTSNLGEIPSGDATTVKYYSLQVTDSAGELLIQNLKLDSTEIRNGDDVSAKSISEEFNVQNLITETATISEATISEITAETATICGIL